MEDMEDKLIELIEQQLKKFEKFRYDCEYYEGYYKALQDSLAIIKEEKKRKGG